MPRLDQLLAARGFGSRKEVAGLLRAGLVQVNGEPARAAAQKINTACDCVTVRGVSVNLSEYIYIMLHKPQGVVSATRDANTTTVLDLIPQHLRRRDLFPVGRLDKDSTGLLLITDDGALAHALLSPHRHVPKVYLATLKQPATQHNITAFAAGLHLSQDEICLPAELIPLEGNMARVVLREGKYHQVKRMFAALGNEVLALHRERMGGLALDENLAPGECRELSTDELENIKS